MLTIIAIASFLLILIGFVLFRQKLMPKLEVKWTDISIAIIPIIIWLLLTGKIKSLQLGELGFETMFQEAAAAKVEEQVQPLSALPVKSVSTAVKGPVAGISNLVAGRTEALRFQVGAQGYQGSAIQEYLHQTQNFLKYLVFEDQQGKFLGIADAKTVYAWDNNSGESEFTLYNLAEWLKADDTDAIKRIPDFLPGQDAIDTGLSKKEALVRMEKLNRDILPVVDKDGKFIGTVDRANLTASMLIDISNKIE